MKKEDMFTIHQQTFSKCFEILKTKNGDYSGKNSNALSNFMAVEHMGIATSEQGLLTRLMDKFKRLININNNKKIHVANESECDTIDDMINYLIIYKCILIDKKEENNGS